MKKRLLSALLAMGMIFALAACGGETGGNGNAGNNGSGSNDQTEKITVKVALSVPQGHESYVRTQKMCDSINEACGGAFDFQLYASDALGDWTLVSEEVVRGNIEMTVNSFESTNLAADLLWAPYLADGYDEALKVFSQDGYVYKFIENIYYEEGVTLLGYDFLGFDGLAFGKHYPAEGDVFNGGESLLLRTSGEDHIRKLVEAMGYSPNTMAWAEIYTAVQTGVIDGFTGCAPSLAYTQFGDVLGAYIDCKMLTELCPIYVNNAFFEGLTEEQQAAFRQYAGAMFETSIAETREVDEEYFAKLEEELGVEVIRSSDEKVAALAEYCREECWPVLEELMGADAYNEMMEYYNSLT